MNPSPVGMDLFLNYFKNDEICTVLGGRSRDECYILNRGKKWYQWDTHWPKWDGISLPHQLNLTTQQLPEWKILHLCPASQNIGTCASIGFDAENPKSNLVTIGTRFLITGLVTAQKINQLYTTRPRGLLYLRDVYIILNCLKLYDEKFINRT